MTDNKKIALMFLLLIVFLAGALALRDINRKPNANKPNSSENTKITKGTWELIEYADVANDQPVPQDFAATTIFDSNGGVQGSGGCNSYSAKYSLEDNKLSVSEIESTLMACDNSSDIEAIFMRHLQNTATYELKESSLILYDSYGNAILKFRNVEV